MSSVPPKANKEGFDNEVIVEIAKAKLAELESKWIDYEETATPAEEKNYQTIDSSIQYSKDWFLAMISLYSINKKRTFFGRWWRYWEKLADIKRPAPKGFLSNSDLDNARDFLIENLLDTELRNAGAGRRKTNCPFHEERTPSFFVYDDNSYHCFGCGVHGNNAIDFLVAQGMDFKEAIANLA